MPWQLTLYSMLAFLAAAISVAVAITAWQYRDDPVAPSFIVLVLATAVWSFTYGVQLATTALSTKILFEQLGYVGAVVAPTAWLVLTLRYAGRDEWLTDRTLTLLAVEPAITLLLVWTNSLHGLVWRDAVVAGRSLSVLSKTLGPWYWVNVGYSYLVVLLGVFLLLRVFLRSPRLYRTQAGVLVVGAVVPLGANAAFVAGWSPIPDLELTPFALTVTGSVFGLALFRLGLLDLDPVARRRFIEEAGDGVVVLDARDRVVDANAVARRILDAESVVDRHATAVLPDAPDMLDGRTVRAEVDGLPRAYDLRTVTLRDHRDRPAGRVVAMRDVTELKAYEQRLEVANRVLRHNLRNEMNLVGGLAEQLAEETAGDTAERARRIRSTAMEMVDLSEKARFLGAAVGGESARLESVDVAAVVATAVERARASAPHADVSLESPETALVAGVGDEALETAVSNVVENAIQHNDTDAPRVSVSVAQTGEWVSVRVADDGPGIPETETRVLTEGNETPLMHGSGLGLWLVYWIVTNSGGDLTFETNDPRGSVVTLRLRARS